MKLSSAIPAVVAALGAEVALAVPVVQDVSYSHLGSQLAPKKALTNAVSIFRTILALSQKLPVAP